MKDFIIKNLDVFELGIELILMTKSLCMGEFLNAFIDLVFIIFRLYLFFKKYNSK